MEKSTEHDLIPGPKRCTAAQKVKGRLFDSITQNLLTLNTLWWQFIAAVLSKHMKINYFHPRNSSLYYKDPNALLVSTCQLNLAWQKYTTSQNYNYEDVHILRTMPESWPVWTCSDVIRRSWLDRLVSCFRSNAYFEFNDTKTGLCSLVGFLDAVRKTRNSPKSDRTG